MFLHIYTQTTHYKFNSQKYYIRNSKAIYEITDDNNALKDIRTLTIFKALKYCSAAM